MTKPTAPLCRFSDISVALGLLSRLPMQPAPQALARGGLAAWAYPIAGLIIGTLAALTGLLALSLGLPAPLAALLSLTASILLSGAMHEDGLADTVDGLWGGASAERRLEIMKDSHIGPFGVIALVLSLLARWAAFWLLFQAGGWVAFAAILSAAALSRAGMPVLIWALPNARQIGLSHAVGPVGGQTVLLGLGLALAAGLGLLGAAAFGAVLMAGLVTLGLGLIARAKIGGQTGDILGASQQLVEIAALFSILA